ncbi:MAG TPA: phosphatase PAP2 family protein [Saprospiraceae bacterium]|nr:phosphatase PAP2 family protein [Saprospiraceae bacterium]HMQ82921.1 phosphatase PAP2 family protein [Saprospiraceae bacterium]
MKNIVSKIFAFSLLVISVFLSSCEKDLPTQANYLAYTYSKIDENGGSWTPVLLSSADQIAIPVPEAVGSSAFQEELAFVKSESSSLSGEQLDAVEYWTNNPALRWNEIALELIAKYNLIPGPNADDTYTLPNPANPGEVPYFPFAHPPYAVRALSYLSVAQFDGLISAWHYKYLYNRPSPGLADNSITAAYVENNIPSYPSDGAVIAAVSRDILSVMFPLEKDYLAERAEEHMSSLIWAGANVESDISAGAFIGEEVAKIALARASTDGMSKAQCPKPISDSLQAAAFDRFGWKWENIEIPARPVGLTPLFGQVKLWNVPNVEVVRPPVPPAPGSAEFEESVVALKNYADNMTEEWRAIANYWQDGLGTYTPPGHWNRYAKEYAIKYKLNPLRTVRVFAYLNMAMMDGGISCWDAKYYYHYPRPINLIPGYKTIAGTPNFPSYTSGHSVFSAAGAEVMTYMFPEEGSLFRDYAVEAAISRVYGGIHWIFDAEVGTTQGIEVASYTLDVAKADGAD